MERIKKRNSKFGCLFGGNDEFPSQRFVESSSPANPTELMFEVGKISSKQSNGNQMKKLLPKGILNGLSSKKRSTSILAKLVGRRRDSSEIVDRSSGKLGKNKERLVCNGTACEWRGAKETVSVKEGFNSGKNKERLVCNGTACEWRGAKETVSDISEVKEGFKGGKNKELVCNETVCEWRGAKEIVSDISSEVKQGFKGGKNKELVCNETACEWRGAKETVLDISSEVKQGFKSGKNKELVCNETACEWRGAKETVSDICSEAKESNSKSGHADYYGYDESLHERSDSVSESKDKRGKNKELLCNGTVCEWRGAKQTVSDISEMKEGFKSGHVDYYGYGESLHVLRSGSVSESEDKRGKNKELVCNETACEWGGAKEIVPEISSEAKEGFKSVHVDYYGYDETSDSFSESEEITVSSRIIIDHHDRLTHSISLMSQSSLITEATNMLLERCITHMNEDEGEISEVEKEAEPNESGKVTTLVAVHDVFASSNGLGSLVASSSGSTSVQPSFDDPNHTKNVGHDEDDADEKTITESSFDQCRRKVQKDVFIYKEDLPLKMIRPNKRFQSSQKSIDICFKNEDPAKYQPSASDIGIDVQVYGPESEDLAFASDDTESINARLQDLKKNIHQLTVESTIISAKLGLIPKVKHFGQLSAYMEHILHTLENHDTDETIHHPIDHMLFNCLEYYYEDTALSTMEKGVFYDYVEHMLVRTSKSTAVYPWVNPVKRESQLGLLKPDLEDQIRNVVYEIEKDYHEDFCEIYYNKDSEWVQPTNDIDILGMLTAELVLNDLLQEVIGF